MGNVSTFRLGTPHTSLLPLESLVQATQQLRDNNQATCLSYGEVQGSSALRAEILSCNASYYPQCTPDQLILTHGVTEAITLTARALLKAGDVVFVEAPTYHWALPDFISMGVKIIQIATDEEGMSVDVLEAELERARYGGLRPKLIYCMPTFHNPTGATLSLSRRLRLLEIARQFQTVILEDDPYFSLRYRGSELPSLIALDHEGLVIHSSTFSKLIAPGVRLGWVLTRSPELLRSLLYLKPNGANPFLAATLVNYLQSGAFEPHVERLRRHYDQSYEICSATLAKLGAANIQSSRPEGGFYFWLRLPLEWSAADFTSYCNKRSLDPYCGDEFFAHSPLEPCVRLAFSSFTHEELSDQLTQFCAIAETYSRLMQPQQSYAKETGRL